MAKHLISSTRTIEAMKADKHRLSDGDGLYIKPPAATQTAPLMATQTAPPGRGELTH
jgi:hypothetical protein